MHGRQSAPLPDTNSLFNDTGRLSAPLSKNIPPESEQLAWAAKESLRLEEDRKKREKQEEAELQLAIQLSKKDKSNI